MLSIFVDVSLFCSHHPRIAITCLTALNIDTSYRIVSHHVYSTVQLSMKHHFNRPSNPASQPANQPFKYVLYVVGWKSEITHATETHSLVRIFSMSQSFANVDIHFISFGFRFFFSSSFCCILLSVARYELAACASMIGENNQNVCYWCCHRQINRFTI